jgi:hypothetical protein
VHHAVIAIPKASAPAFWPKAGPGQAGPDVADAPECATERRALPVDAGDLSITNTASRDGPD